MSDNWIRIVPIASSFCPSIKAAEKAAFLLQEFLPDSDEVKFEYAESVEFYDAGENWEGVNCPSCGADLQEWWPEEMGRAYEKHFSDLSCEVPCCGIRSNLNDLNYPWMVAFGSFSIEAMNPNVSEFPAEIASELESLLGTRVKLIWQRL